MVSPNNSFIWFFVIIFQMSHSLVPELSTWAEDRFIQCVYCMDYERVHVSLFGCKPRRQMLCTGNACFMRFHKGLTKPHLMYTSGCLNLTNSEMSGISDSQKKSGQFGNPKGTLLCELADKMDTCICTNMNACNLINLSPDFSEYNRTSILENVGIDEVGHIRVFLPNEYRKLKLIENSAYSWSTLNILFVFGFILLF